jgi:hypothetical protein
MKKVARTRGRPAKYEDQEVLRVKIEEYFKKCPDTRSVYFEGKEFKIPCPTITGLALYLGFCSRRSLYDYAEKLEFAHPIKSGITKVERMYETMLHGPSPTGAIFALKNFGWTDKDKTDVSGVVINQVIAVTYADKPNSSKDPSPTAIIQRFDTPVAT